MKSCYKFTATNGVVKMIHCTEDVKSSFQWTWGHWPVDVEFTPIPGCCDVDKDIA